jgi:hypothetical protein
MLVTLFGMVTLARLLQNIKAASSMIVTLFGMITLARLSHAEKALSPMLVTPLGIVIPISVVQPSKIGKSVALKALSGIEVIVLLVRSRLTYLFSAPRRAFLIIVNSPVLLTFNFIKCGEGALFADSVAK